MDNKTSKFNSKVEELGILSLELVERERVKGIDNMRCFRNRLRMKLRVQKVNLDEALKMEMKTDLEKVKLRTLKQTFKILDKELTN